MYMYRLSYFFYVIKLQNVMKVELFFASTLTTGGNEESLTCFLLKSVAKHLNIQSWYFASVLSGYNCYRKFAYFYPDKCIFLKDRIKEITLYEGHFIM